MSTNSANANTFGYDAWIERLSEQDLPVMAGIINELNQITDNSESSAVEVAEIILKDASLTSQVLKVVNCVYYNRHSTPINTVSRAVVLLGIASIKTICVSVLVLEQFATGEYRDRLLKELAKAFHAATQAKNLFKLKSYDTEVTEAVIIAGLLSNLGETAFWSFGGNQAEKLNALLNEGELSTTECEKKIIGVALKDITLGMSEKWGMEDILKPALSDHPSKEPAVRALQLGKELVRSIETGWESRELKSTLRSITKHYGIELEEAKELAQNSAQEAANIVLNYGANQLCHLIPSPEITARSEELEPMNVDQALQLNILRELSTMAEEKVDLNTFFHAVLEGIHRGVGFERAAIALYNADRSSLTAKHLLRQRTSDWQDKFTIPLSKQSVFNHCLQSKTLAIVEHDSDHQLLESEKKELENQESAILAPILVGQRLLGVYYADRGNNGLTLDTERKEGFRHFSQQANMCLSIIASKA